jgi:hypothetical protein
MKSFRKGSIIGLQAILSIALLFLLALGIRNKFKIK